MQEGNYSKACIVYQNLLKYHKDEILKKQQLEINNNIADCYIHLEVWNCAQEHINVVCQIEKDNTMALYSNGVILLNKLLKDDESNQSQETEFSYRRVYDLFDDLMRRKSGEKSINSAWLISAILLYKNTKDEKLKENITKQIQYSVGSISMKSYFYLADFILEQLDEDEKIENLDYNNLYRDFCCMKLIESGENKAFQFLMNKAEFHYFERKDRAFILAHIVQMYKYVLHIKDRCRFTYNISDNSFDLPYHYTKLSTLKCLLKESDIEEPRLRLWNSVYMNDAYEGGIFSKLLIRAALLGSEEVDVEYKRIMDILESYIGNPTNLKVQGDSNVYITSFSTAEDSFQMWNIYGDNEKGVAIKFDEDFFDIKNKWQDLILDEGVNECALYKVQYLDINDSMNEEEIMDDLKKIWENIDQIENRLNSLQIEVGAKKEVRNFITDRLNEIRFLFKTSSYEYENELRLIRCSHSPDIDDKNFEIPRLYIDVNKKIKNLDVKIGSKLEKQQVKDLFVWLSNSGKVKSISVSKLNK